MPKIEVDVSDAEFFALEMVTNDPVEFAGSVVTNRARVAVEDLKASTEWAEALAAEAQAEGGNPSDPWAVLIRGRDLGLFETAAVIQERQLAEFEAMVEAIEAQEPVDAEGPVEVSPLDQSLDRVQFFTILQFAFKKTVADLVDLVKANVEDELAQIHLIQIIENRQKFKRQDPWVVSLSGLLELSPEQVDEAWVRAAELA